MKDFDINKIRSQFPFLKVKPYGHDLAFFDTAASAQKPKIVINAIKKCYETEYANIHRGIYYLSSIATEKFEESRKAVQKFINAQSEKEIIFTKGATEAINLVASSYGENFLKKDDEIIISELEHHANIVPWKILADKIGLKLRIIPIDENGDIDLNIFEKLLCNKTKLVAINHMSNVLGTIVPISEIIKKSHDYGAKVLIDACQSITHMGVDVKSLDCDFLVFSAHKLYGPNGVGILYGKYDILKNMPPYQGGGEMISEVTFDKITFQKPPIRFEAGTPAIAEVIAFKKSLAYLNSIDLKKAWQYGDNLLKKIKKEISHIKGYKIIGNPKNQAAILSFKHEKIHPSDIGDIIDKCGVAIRSGNHCAQPLMSKLNTDATARISIGIYNNEQDAENLLNALTKVNKIFKF